MNIKTVAFRYNIPTTDLANFSSGFSEASGVFTVEDQDDGSWLVRYISGQWNGQPITGIAPPGSFGNNDNLVLWGPGPVLTSGGITFTVYSNGVPGWIPGNDGLGRVNVYFWTDGKYYEDTSDSTGGPDFILTPTTPPMVAGVIPIVYADFLNGIYWMNGAYYALEDLFLQAAYSRGNLWPGDLVIDSDGLLSQYPTGAEGETTSSPVATISMMDALNPAFATGIVAVTKFFTDVSPNDPSEIQYPSGDPTAGGVLFQEYYNQNGSYYINEPGFQYYIDANAGDSSLRMFFDPTYVKVAGNPPPGPNQVVWSYAPNGQIGIAANGGPAAFAASDDELIAPLGGIGPNQPYPNTLPYFMGNLPDGHFQLIAYYWLQDVPDLSVFSGSAPPPPPPPPSPPACTPIVYADFVNGVYFINGTAVTFDDLITEYPTIPGQVVVDSEGLLCQDQTDIGYDPGPGKICSYPLATDTFLRALEPHIGAEGCVCIIKFTCEPQPENTGNGTTVMRLDNTDDVIDGQLRQDYDFVANAITMRSYNPFPGNVITTGAAPAAAQNQIAWSYVPGQQLMEMSVNGGPTLESPCDDQAMAHMYEITFGFGFEYPPGTIYHCQLVAFYKVPCIPNLTYASSLSNPPPPPYPQTLPPYYPSYPSVPPVRNMRQLFANDAVCQLAKALSSTSTTVTLATGAGELFPSPGTYEFFTLTFTDQATKLIKEITYCTQRVGDVCTVMRGQENTIPLSWNIGDVAYNPVTMDTAYNWSQEFFTQIQPDNYGLDVGTTNGLLATLNYQPENLAVMQGAPVRIKKASQTNTGPVTLAINGLAVTPVVNPDGSPMRAGELPGGGIFTVIYDGINFQLQSQPAQVTKQGNPAFLVGLGKYPPYADFIFPNNSGGNVPFDTAIGGVGSDGLFPNTFDDTGQFVFTFIEPEISLTLTGLTIVNGILYGTGFGGHALTTPGDVWALTGGPLPLEYPGVAVYNTQVNGGYAVFNGFATGTFIGTIAGNTLTITPYSNPNFNFNGLPSVGDFLQGPGVLDGTTVTGRTDNTHFTVSTSQSVGPITMNSAAQPNPVISNPVTLTLNNLVPSFVCQEAGVYYIFAQCYMQPDQMVGGGVAMDITQYAANSDLLSYIEMDSFPDGTELNNQWSANIYGFFKCAVGDYINMDIGPAPSGPGAYFSNEYCTFMGGFKVA
jgi:hypothetical protein